MQTICLLSGCDPCNKSVLYFVIVILATWQCQHILCIHYWVELSLMLSSLLYFVIVIYFAIFSYIFATFSYIFLYFCYCMWWARTENKQLHLAHLRVYMMRGAAKCRNCREVGGKCKDGEDVTGLENPGVLRAGLVLARRYPGEKTICSFSGQADFLFPMPESIGQAEVVSWTGKTPQSFGAAPRPASFVLRCIGHNKQLVGWFDAYNQMTHGDSRWPQSDGPI